MAIEKNEIEFDKSLNFLQIEQQKYFLNCFHLLNFARCYLLFIHTKLNCIYLTVFLFSDYCFSILVYLSEDDSVLRSNLTQLHHLLVDQACSSQLIKFNRLVLSIFTISFGFYLVDPHNLLSSIVWAQAGWTL